MKHEATEKKLKIIDLEKSLQYIIKSSVQKNIKLNTTCQNNSHMHRKRTGRIFNKILKMFVFVYFLFL